MLIRSQDQTALTKFDKIYIIPSLNDFLKKENPKRDLIAAMGNCTTFIGTYSTKEKAMKVLDEIEKTYVGTLWTEKDTIIANRIVFEMPQDDEVKV